MGGPDRTVEVAHAPLRRVLGVRGVAAASFNGMVGVGIFGLPGLVAAVLGPAAILAYLVCLILIGLVGLCLAEAGSRVSDAGGLYAYSRAAYGPVLSGVVGMLVLVANTLASSAALARFLLDALASLWPALGGATAGIVLLALLYGALAIVNVRGAKSGARLTAFMAVVKLAPLVLLVVAGLFAIDPVNLAWPDMPGVAAIGQGAVILVFAFVGIETGLATSGEARDPARTIPRAIALTLVMVATLYIGLQLVAQGVLGPALAAQDAPVVATATKVFGPSVTKLMVALSAVSAAGYLVADMLSSPRVAFALAEHGQLPRALAWVHPRYGTPSVAILAYAAAAFALAASGTFRQLVLLASSGTLILYAINCLGVLRLRARGVAMAGPPFVVPGGAIAPVLATLLIAALLWTLAWQELAAALGLVGLSAVGYALLERHRRAS